MCHVGRMAFEEPIFEEILAYRTATSSYRRWLGPIVKSSIESALFLLLLFIIFLFDLFFIFSENLQVFPQMMWLKLIPLLFVGYGFFRLCKRHRQLNLCLKNLTKACGSESVASYVTYRLTDQEIFLFSQWTPKKIQNYAKREKEKSFRWKIIHFCYFCFSL